MNASSNSPRHGPTSFGRFFNCVLTKSARQTYYFAFGARASDAEYHAADSSVTAHGHSTCWSNDRKTSYAGPYTFLAPFQTGSEPQTDSDALPVSSYATGHDSFAHTTDLSGSDANVSSDHSGDSSYFANTSTHWNSVFDPSDSGYDHLMT